jgi:hypothetical protein
VLLTAGASAAAALACAARQQPPREPQVVSLEALASTPGRFVGTEIRVRGRLNAQGNYFSRDHRVFLTDEKGHRIYVRPFLPLSVPPGRSDQIDGKPRTMSDVLGEHVELRGRLRTPKVEGSTEMRPIFEVSSYVLSPPEGH